MSDRNGSLSDCDIQSYVDGELDQTQRSEVDRVLARCPVTAARVEDYQRINEALRGLHAEVLDEPVPDRFLDNPTKRSSQPWLRIAAGVAASLVGAIVGELPTGAVAGLGARLLSGSYYGQTVQIWAALFAAAIVAASLVGLIGWAERRVLRSMGMGR